MSLTCGLRRVFNVRSGGLRTKGGFTCKSLATVGCFVSWAQSRAFLPAPFFTALSTPQSNRSSNHPPPSREEVTSPLHATLPLHDPLDLLSIRGLLHRSLPGSRSLSSRGEVMSPCMFVSPNQLYLRQFQEYYLFLTGSTTRSPALPALRGVFTQPDRIG
jgi:hypothetical protein